MNLHYVMKNFPLHNLNGMFIKGCSDIFIVYLVTFCLYLKFKYTQDFYGELNRDWRT